MEEFEIVAPGMRTLRILPATAHKRIAREWARRNQAKRGDMVVDGPARPGHSPRRVRLRRITTRAVLPWDWAESLLGCTGGCNDEPIGPWPAGSIILGGVDVSGPDDAVFRRVVVYVDAIASGQAEFNGIFGTDDAPAPFPSIPL